MYEFVCVGTIVCLCVCLCICVSVRVCVHLLYVYRFSTSCNLYRNQTELQLSTIRMHKLLVSYIRSILIHIEQYCALSERGAEDIVL